MHKRNVRFIVVIVSSIIICLMIGFLLCSTVEAKSFYNGSNKAILLFNENSYDLIPPNSRREPWKYSPKNPWKAEPRRKPPRRILPPRIPEQPRQRPNYMDPKLEWPRNIPA